MVSMPAFKKSFENAEFAVSLAGEVAVGVFAADVGSVNVIWFPLKLREPLVSLVSASTST